MSKILALLLATACAVLLTVSLVDLYQHADRLAPMLAEAGFYLVALIAFYAVYRVCRE